MARCTIIVKNATVLLPMALPYYYANCPESRRMAVAFLSVRLRRPGKICLKPCLMDVMFYLFRAHPLRFYLHNMFRALKINLPVFYFPFLFQLVHKGLYL